MTSHARLLRSCLLALTVTISTSLSASAIEMTPELRDCRRRQGRRFALKFSRFRMSAGPEGVKAAVA
jgi:hypothetical protein